MQKQQKHPKVMLFSCNCHVENGVGINFGEEDDADYSAVSEGPADASQGASSDPAKTTSKRPHLEIVE